MSKATLRHSVEKGLAPFVSIGMPVYNGERYIREALNSLLNQTFADFELIISDNASTDATEEICKKYATKDSRIRYIRQPANRGASSNFKFVLDEARGEYFMWAAADDVWDQGWISGMLDAMNKTGSKAAFGIVQFINERSEEIRHYANNLIFEYRGAPLARQLNYFLQFEGTGKANPIYALWKIGNLRKIKIEECKYDYSMIFDLLKNADVAGYGDAKMYKRHHPDCAGGGVIKPTSRGVVGTLRIAWVHLTRPFHAGLISEYLRLSGSNMALFIAILPIKYLLAYWFLISNNRFTFRFHKTV